MTREEAQIAWEKIVDIGFSNYERLSKDQKVWFNIEPLTLGGIIDHYINHGADYNQDTIDALQYLGFQDMSELMQKVNNLYKNGQPPIDKDERNEQWNTWCNKYEVLLEEIDNKFWDKAKDLEHALLKHINSTRIGIT